MHRPPEGVEGAQVTRLPSFKALLKELRSRNAVSIPPVSARACLQPSNVLLSPLQDLLALLHEQGPSTEGIFRLAASECASRDIREALDTGAQVHLASQPVHVLAVILKVSPADLESGAADGQLCEQEPKLRSCSAPSVLGMLPVLPAALLAASPAALAIAGLPPQDPLQAPPLGALPAVDGRPAKDQQAGEAGGAQRVSKLFAARGNTIPQEEKAQLRRGGRWPATQAMPKAVNRDLSNGSYNTKNLYPPILACEGVQQHLWWIDVTTILQKLLLP
ncbi:hypothetical protein Q9233_003861 [Columba guinea]|nr:hypothetical protein Q9233_003861 [Columba guinea]